MVAKFLTSTNFFPKNNAEATIDSNFQEMLVLPVTSQYFLVWRYLDIFFSWFFCRFSHYHISGTEKVSLQ